MDWLRRFFRLGPGAAQRKVNSIEQALAELRAKVRELPPEEQKAYAEQIHALVEEQARAHNALNDALDDRYKR